MNDTIRDLLAQIAALDFYERLHCEYCAYANGLLAYCAEVVARTEQYFCPIKHARKVLGTHARYRDFLDYGDAGGAAQAIDRCCPHAAARGRGEAVNR